MQRFIITTIIAASFAGSALAESPLASGTETFVSTKSRAEVQAELAQFKKAGVNPWSTSYNPLAAFRSTKSRAEVTAGYLTERDEVHAFTAEDSGDTLLRSAARSIPVGNVLAAR
jgi:hypothetical protein